MAISGIVKVVIVDDAAAVRGVLRALLAEEGYKIVGELASGASLPELVARAEPDVVCLDYHLPGSDGIELLKGLHEAHPDVAVVLITGSSEPDLENAAAEAGAAGFIRKPFSPDTILREIGQVAHARRLLAAQRQTGAPHAVVQARATAVVADDSGTMRQLLKAILEHAAVEVVGEAWDGKQAVELVAERRPDLVFLDIDMPVMDGLEALAAIHAAHPAAKVLMITGNARREAILQAGKSGARGYILKPFQPAKVAEAIDKLLG